MSISDFEFLNKLGEGAYSQVFKARRKSDKKIYALKQVRFKPLKEKEKENALNQVRILASVDHPNVVGYRDAFIDQESNTLCLVMEFADNTDLLQKITQHKRRGTRFREGQIWDVLIQATRGLNALHQLQILHRDLKSANLFLWKDGRVKIGDMNVSKVAKMGLVYTQTGTPYYASPEVWKDKPYDLKSDIWSLGCVIYEAACLEPPFTGKDMQALFHRVIRGEFAPLPSQYSSDLSEIIGLMLNVRPNQRPNCGEILNHRLIVSHMSGLQQGENQNSLLKTIYMPHDLARLTDQLPGPNYGKRNQWIAEMPSLYHSPKVRPQNGLKQRFQSEKALKLDRGEPRANEPLRPYHNRKREEGGAFNQETVAQRIKALNDMYNSVKETRPVYQRPVVVRPSWWG